MIRKRATAVGTHAPIGNYSFRPAWISAYLSNGGVWEHAQELTAHESSRTTKLYDRTRERLTQDEVERIRLDSGLPIDTSLHDFDNKIATNEAPGVPGRVSRLRRAIRVGSMPVRFDYSG